jgi:methionine-rich copper-binding protein CopC
VIVAIFFLLLGQTRMVFAHAILLSSTPTPHTAINGEIVDFALQFNSRIDAPRSLLILLMADGKTTEALSIRKTKSLDSLEAHRSNLPNGSYVLRWQVLANDGHISSGEIPFDVRNGR